MQACVLIVLVAVIAGYYQGMVMSMKGDTTHTLEHEGARGHKHFKYIHALWCLVLAGVAIIGHWFIDHVTLTYYFGMLTVLMAVIANDLFEYAYSYARFKTWLNPYPEHFTIGDLVVKIPWYSKHIHKYGPDYNSYDVPFVGWHWIQILPFHAAPWKMHAFRIGAIIITAVLTLI